MSFQLSAGSVDEVCLYVSLGLAESKLHKYIQKAGLSVAPFDSQLHFSNAIIIERVRQPKKVLNEGFMEQNSKVVILYLDGRDIVTKGEELESCLGRYLRANAKVIVILQNAAEYLSTADLVISQDRGRQEDYQNWLAGLTLRKVDAFETKGSKESASIVLRVAKAIIQGPYKSSATAFCTQSKKLSSQTVISESSLMWANCLVNFPGISEQKAKMITQKYPTMRSLLETYARTDLSKLHKLNLLADLGDGKKQKKLSARLYTFLTSCDGGQVLA